MVPDFMVNLKSFYINTYKDQFFVNTPPFFEFFMWTEIFLQAPVMLWGVGALFRGEPPILALRLPNRTPSSLWKSIIPSSSAHWV
jgi:hypothetical protein